MSQYDASKQNYQEVTIFDRPALFTECRIDRTTVPEGVYRYELRHGDEDWGEPIELSRSLMVNFYGTVLTREPFQLPIDGWIPMENDSLSFQDGGCRTLAEFQEKYPASEKDVIDFYSVNEPALHALYFSRSEEQDKSAGCVGHLRGDFGSGKQFYTTWWPHQQDALNTPEFKADIDRTINWLREQPDSPLRDFDSMNRYCNRYEHKLCVDICKRNGKKKLLWLGDKDKTLSYEPKSDEMVLTVHRWFANKSCPGSWMYARMGDLAAKVTAQLGGGASEGTETEYPEKLTEGYYRVRKAWSDSKSQKGAYKILSNAKKCADANPGYSVFDNNGVNIYTPNTSTQTAPDVPFTVKVSISDLNIRKGPGTDYAKTGKFTGKGVFTIVEVQSGQGASAGWGRLKSGAGWISLDYAVKTE